MRISTSASEDHLGVIEPPANYIAKMAKIRSFPGNEGISAAKGLQGHFNAGQPNLAYMRAALDVFDTTSFPIWLTEHAELLEEILREGYSHPSVEGIIIFARAVIAGFKDMALTYENFHNTPADDVVDKLIKKEARASSFRVTNLSIRLLLFSQLTETIEHMIKCMMITRAKRSTRVG
ncbi:endo-1,4-beta-xylanase 5-like [Arachis stenosperma]|uniref:endo-1,4-beta-xylanase 5-like n=1 Tax=Arachis stenosperma TaxID=217475 RepID=UPI0025AD80A7|nr:endo-1,4-beta-xylanase 5-like [Arachis stenosperma]